MQDPAIEVSWNVVLDAAHYHKSCPEVLVVALEYGGDVNSRGEGGATALHATAKRGDVAGVRLLLQHGADADLKDDAGRRAIDVTRNRRVVQMLDAAD